MTVFRYKYGKLISYQVAMVLAIAMMFVLFYSGVYLTWYRFSPLFLIIGEASLISSILWLVKGNWRLITVIAVWIIGLFLFANECYFRYMGDILPFKQIFQSHSYNSLVFRSVPPLLKWSDLVYLTAPAAITVIYFYLHIPKQSNPKWTRRLLIISAFFLFYIISQLNSARSNMRYLESQGEKKTYIEILKNKFQYNNNCFRLSYWSGNGLLLYCYTQFRGIATWNNYNISPEQRNEITKYLNELQRHQVYKNDSLFKENHNKNLIFIIVESLNADAVGHKINDHSVTPVLDSLISQNGTITCLNMLTQICDGHSSDGQFMYNTGLLPLRNAVVAMDFLNQDYNTLTSAIGYPDAIEIIGESRSMWNHGQSTATYGYSQLIDNITSQEAFHEGEIKDDLILTVALKEMTKLRTPFMAEITTLSMHSPFNDPYNNPPSWLATSCRGITHDYYVSLYAFDRALGKFLSELKRHNLYDNSIIVIASDHEIDYVNDPIRKHGCVFLALNTGVTKCISGPVGQIDVFPTILQIMGRESKWRGLGMSMLDERNRSAVSRHGEIVGTSGTKLDSIKHKAWNISEMMIRGNY